MGFEKKFKKVWKLSDFNNDWLKIHTEHILVSCIHTHFENGESIKYKEHRCYRCNEEAREVIQ